MKHIIITILLMFCAVVAEAGDTRVRATVRSDGTYVAPHYRTAPNSTRYDNYSTKGNYNPYTGRAGTKNPYTYKPPRTTYSRRRY